MAEVDLVEVVGVLVGAMVEVVVVIVEAEAEAVVAQGPIWWPVKILCLLL